MGKSTRERQVQFTLRATREQLATIDCAAKSVGQTRVSFVLNAAMDHATTMLLDRTHFVLDDDTMTHFLTVLGSPLPNPEALQRLMVRRPAWR